MPLIQKTTIKLPFQIIFKNGKLALLESLWKFKIGIKKVSHHTLRAGKSAVYAASRLCVYYSNSSLPSYYVVFFVGFAGRNQGVLSDFYVLRGFLRDCIVILLSLTLAHLSRYLHILSMHYPFPLIQQNDS